MKGSKVFKYLFEKYLKNLLKNVYSSIYNAIINTCIKKLYMNYEPKTFKLLGVLEIS